MMTFPIFVAVVLTTIAIVVWFRNVLWVMKRKKHLCGMVVKQMILWISASENKSMILNTDIRNQRKLVGWVVWSVWFMWIVRRKTIKEMRNEFSNLCIVDNDGGGDMHRREKVTTNQVGIFRRVKKEIKWFQKEWRWLWVWRFALMVGYDHLTIVLVEAFILGIIFRIMKKDEDLLS